MYNNIIVQYNNVIPVQYNGSAVMVVQYMRNPES